MTSGAVELWGLPGAGKSSLAAALTKRGHAGSIMLPTFSEAVASHPVRSSVMNLRLLASGYSHRRLRRFAVRQWVAEQNPVVLEEGIIHEIWRLLLLQPRMLEESWWRPYLSLNRATVLVLKLSPGLARTRIMSKSNPGPINRRLAREPLDGALWATARSSYQLLLQQLKLARESVIELDTSHRTIEDTCLAFERLQK